MAWLFKQKGSSNWWVGYRAGGKIRRFTTKTADITEATAELGRVKAMLAAKSSAENLEQVFEALTGKVIPRATLMGELGSWLREAKNATAMGTYRKYETTASRLKKFLKATESSPLLSEITAEHLRDYMDDRIKTVSAGTVNNERKVLRIFFKRATDCGRLKQNPMLAVKQFKAGRRKKRRAFTVPELKALFHSTESRFWRYMELGGFYTGLRMGDLITLQIEEVDFGKMMIHRGMNKVDGKVVHVPLVQVFADEIRAQINDRKSGPIWPRESAVYQKRGANFFSAQFYDLLHNAPIEPKLVPSRDHQAKKNGRSGQRQANELSFHSLRHTFITFLKNTGATPAVARELAGHSSDAMSDLYTHLPAETLAHAVAQLPQFVESPSPRPKDFGA